ncbi:MAG: hypothetical protein ACRDPQ_12845 [Nocardioidaceae bacterium]
MLILARGHARQRGTELPQRRWKAPLLIGLAIVTVIANWTEPAISAILRGG